jgi:hypothetical protein
MIARAGAQPSLTFAVAPFGRRQGHHRAMDRQTSIVSGRSIGFSGHSHETEYRFVVVFVHAHDFAGGSIRAVRPTLPRGS